MTRSVVRPLAAFGVLGVVALVVGAQSPATTPIDERTAKLVVASLESKHMAHPTIDDETAQKWAKMFFKDLDPLKYNFLKSDIDEFMPRANTLDDKIRDGNLDFARDVFARFLQRSDERYKMIGDLLKEKPDFTVDESMSDDFDKLEYPADDADARERMRQRIKLDLLRAKIDKEPEDEAVKKLEMKYHDLNRFWHQANSSDLLEYYLSSLSQTFDPHTSYMNRFSLDDLIQQTLQLSLTGIGASLMSEGGYAVVKELIPGGPADKDGRIQPEDKIVGVQKDDGTEDSFVEKRLRDVVAKIRGDAGTHVRLIIQPASSKEKKVYDIVRQKVEMTESHAKGQLIETTTPDGKTLKVGLIVLPAFYGDSRGMDDKTSVSCTNDCRRLIDGFKTKGVDALMMDLRGNGGGLLNEAISLSGLFIDTGPVVQVRETNTVELHEDNDAGTAWDGPLVVLIDRQSASASEIFAGAIKDYGRGLIIGDASTFGKGTVQQIIPIKEAFSFRNTPNMGALKLTIQQFYRVNGDSTQVKGVEPDIHIPSIFDQAEFGEGKMDNALKFDHVAARPHDQFNRVPADLVARLNTLSEKRRAENEKFQKRDAAIKRIIDRKSRHAISLNEAKFRAETASEEESNDEAKAAGKAKKNKLRLAEHPAWEPNYYNDELLHIVGDYLTIGHDAFTAAPLKAAAN